MKLLKSFHIPSKALVLGGALLTTIGLGSLGIVWLRLEISSVAEDSRKLEKEVTDNARELRGLNTKRAKALNPASLKSLVSNRLSKPDSSRVIFVQRQDLQRRQSIPLLLASRPGKQAGKISSQRLALR